MLPLDSAYRFAYHVSFAQVVGKENPHRDHQDYGKDHRIDAEYVYDQLDDRYAERQSECRKDRPDLVSGFERSLAGAAPEYTFEPQDPKPRNPDFVAAPRTFDDSGRVAHDSKKSISGVKSRSGYSCIRWRVSSA